MFKVLRNGPLQNILYTCPNLWCNSCSKCYALDRFGTYSTHAQTCDVTRVQSATQWTASVHTRDTCPNLWCNSCWKCYAMDCFGTYTLRMPKLWCNSCSKCYLMDRFGAYSTHAQTCDVTRVPVLRNGPLQNILYTCPNLWCNSCSKCYAMDRFGTYPTHAQTCDVTHVQSATQWTASEHILHMPKPVM